MKKILFTICGRAGSKGVAGKNLKTIYGKPMVYYSLSAIDLFIKENTKYDCDIVLNTDSSLLVDLVTAKYPEVDVIIRDESLAGDSVAKEDVYRDCVLQMEKRKNKKYDMLIDLDITSPLRQAEDLPGIVKMFLSEDDLDLVMSAAESRRNPYYNMARLDDKGYACRVIENRNTARQQAPVCYDVNASLYVFSRDFLVEKMTFDLWQGKIKIYPMMDTGILDIDSENDYMMIDALSSILFEKIDGFKKIRDNIRE